jgi:hypothetical protein
MFKMLNGIPFVFLSNPDTDYNEKLKQFALAIEPKLLYLPITDGWEEKAESSPTTSRYGAYNTFLLDPITWPLLNLIRAGYWLMIQSLNIPRYPRLIESWINVHRREEHLHRHSHFFPFIANYSVNAEASSTIYGTEKRCKDDVEIKNKNGQLVVTLGYPLYHEVTPWQFDEPRITIACDIAGPEVNYSQRVFLPFDA